MKIWKRTKRTIFYFACPSLFFLTLFFATRDYSDFIASLLTPFSIILAVLTVYFTFKLIKVFYGIAQYKKFINFVDPSKYMIVHDGSPGTGKSSSSSEYCVILADLMWDKIKWDNWLLKNTQEEWQGNRKAALDYRETKEAYEYWTEKPNYIPCLMSNIDSYENDTKTSGMTVDDKKVEYYSFEMFNQEVPVMYGSVCHVEEIGDWAGNKLSNKKDELEGVSKNCRYCRHYGYHIDMNDQDKNNVYKDARRPVAINQTLESQTWTCKPKLLLKLQDFLKRRIERGGYTDNKKLARFMAQLERVIVPIGFRKYKSKIIGNIVLESQAQLPIRKFNFYIPSTLLAKFDDRYKRRIDDVQPEIPPSA